MFDLLDSHAVETLIELFNEELAGVTSVGSSCFTSLFSFALLLQFADVFSHPSLFGKQFMFQASSFSLKASKFVFAFLDEIFHSAFYFLFHPFLNIFISSFLESLFVRKVLL
jgi:hypothetical protein